MRKDEKIATLYGIIVFSILAIVVIISGGNV